MNLVKISNHNGLQKFIFVILLILAWEITARAGLFNQLVFPSFSSIGAVFAEQVASGFLPRVTLYSLGLILKGLGISLVLAIVLSFLSTLSRLAENMVDVLNSILHPLPGIALLPVAMLWFGLSEASIIFIIVHSVLWPMVLNFITGFKSIPRIYMEVGQNYGLKGFRLLTEIMLPSSLPYLLSGIKIGWARAWRAAIAGEMVFGAVGTAGGLGWQIFKTRYDFDITGTFAALLAITIIGVLVEELFFKSIEKATVKKWGMSV